MYFHCYGPGFSALKEVKNRAVASFCWRGWVEVVKVDFFPRVEVTNHWKDSKYTRHGPTCAVTLAATAQE